MALPNIQIGDDLIQDARLASVEVVQELNRHWLCTVVCRQTEDKRIPVEDFLGKSIEVKTVDEDGTEHIHFSGFVHDVDLRYEVWGSYSAQFKAISFSYKMDVTAHKQYYPAQTLSSVAGTVGGRSGVAVAVQAGSSKSLDYVQYGETDFSFLSRIVDDYGCWLRPTETGIQVADSFQTGGKLQWREENGLTAFQLRGTLSPGSFGGSHYDHHVMQSNTFADVSTAPNFYGSAQRLTSAVMTASKQALPSAFEPQRARAMTLDDYQTQLEAESVRSTGGSIVGTGESRTQTLQAGDAVILEGSLDAAGTYGLVKVVHQWDPNGYMNLFVCTPWMQYRNPHPPKARTWNGVVSARVVAHNDPKKMGRLQVQFFWQNDNSTHWARMVSPHAGPDRGFMFMPEVGDEVSVAFEDGDPERPIILGSLWNGVHTAPREELYGEDIPANDVKRILTKSGNRMQLIDTAGRETVVMATPHSTSLKMTESYSTTGGRPMIILHSEGDIVLSAPNGRIHLQSAYHSRQVGDL